MAARYDNRLAYAWHSAGAEDALPLVCIHGSLCDRSFFAPLDGALPGIRALCVDLPGHGASGRTTDSDEDAAAMELLRMATAVITLLDSLNIMQADWAIAGHSLGGAVALLVIELIANGEAPRVAVPAKRPRLPRFFLSFEGNATPACCAAQGHARRVAAMPQPPSAAETLQMVSATPTWHSSAARIGDSVGVLAHQIWLSLVEWCDGRTLHSATLEQMQRRVPLRYVYGSTSGKYHATNQAAHAIHPDASAACVDEAGHFMLIDDPASTLAALRRLLSGLVDCEPSPAPPEPGSASDGTDGDAS